jgi:hypothetical protein
LGLDAPAGREQASRPAGFIKILNSMSIIDEIKDKLKMKDRPPKWCGFCSDGYGIKDGKLYFEPRKPIHDRRRHEYELQCIEYGVLQNDLIEAGLLPAIIEHDLHGQTPTNAQIKILCDALLRLPLAFRRAIVEKRQRIEAIPGRDARQHEKFKFIKRKSLGVTDGKLAVIAADLQPEALVTTLYHEIGHLISLQNLCSILSESRLWLKIWKEDLSTGVVPNDCNQRELSEEYFADGFSKYYFSPASRESLSLAVKQYMQNLPIVLSACS